MQINQPIVILFCLSINCFFFAIAYSLFNIAEEAQAEIGKLEAKIALLSEQLDRAFAAGFAAGCGTTDDAEDGKSEAEKPDELTEARTTIAKYEVLIESNELQSLFYLEANQSESEAEDSKSDAEDGKSDAEEPSRHKVIGKGS